MAMTELNSATENLPRDGECYADIELAKRIDNAPQVGPAGFREYVEDHGVAGYGVEVISMVPLSLDCGAELYRARPGRVFIADDDGEVLVALNRNLACAHSPRLLLSKDLLAQHEQLCHQQA